MVIGYVQAVCGGGWYSGNMGSVGGENGDSVCVSNV